MEARHVRAVLFTKDLDRVAAFYIGALGLTRASGDREHTILHCDGFELILHQIPKAIADTIVITEPPVRRVWGALRLDYPVTNVEDARRLARSLGGDVDEAPPPWAGRDASFFSSATIPRATSSG